MKLSYLMMLFIPTLAFAAGGGSYFPHDPANIKERDNLSKQRGAQLYVNYCLGCHSMQYQRYERVANDLQIPISIAEENLILGDHNVGNLMTNAMDEEDAKNWFGAPPPDLTLVARVRGVDWLYNYMRAFYVDPDRPYGVNNTVFENVGMPHVLADLQGLQTYTGDPNAPFKLVKEGSMSPTEYDQAIRDLVNFLAYSGEPMKLERESLGVKVLLFLLVFIGFAYFLKKEYWKDVH